MRFLAAIGGALAFCAMLMTHTAQAQETAPALLLADQLLVGSDGSLTAEGNVEALFDGARLTATRVVYDRDADQLRIDGPLRITYPDGAILLSDAAELDAGFRNGLLQGARLVLDEQLQLAAVEGRRVDGRLTQLSRVAVTSCQVCGQSGVPLWQIRASRVVHDEDARQLYFDDAQFRILDMPVFYLPRLRLPDPTLKRARGFLIPELQSSTLLGFGIRLPYFIPLGDHADLTITPYVSTVTRTLEYRLRRAFARGDITVVGAASRDTLQGEDLRGYLFAEGAFDLRRDFQLRFDIETVRDASYLSDYNYSDKDRLDSALIIERARRDRYEYGALHHFESLRDTEDNATQPTIVLDIGMARRFALRHGGEIRTAAEFHTHYRYSDLDTDSDDADSIVDGRDISRITAELSYLNRWTLAGGLRAGFQGTLWADGFQISQDATSVDSFAQVTPAAQFDLRWPWTKTADNGARTLIEPLAQYGWIGGSRDSVPNEESTRVEFDESNLLSLSRFPAADRRERGQIGALGFRWLRHHPGGVNAALTLGRVWRETQDTAFSQSSGLRGTTSDWLIAGGFSLPNGARLSARTLMDDDFDISKAEARAAWANGRLDLTATYLLLVQDSNEDRQDTLSEWNFDGGYFIDNNWTARASGRYDLASDNLARAGLGLNYRNECVEVGFSVSRRFTSSSNVEPSTNFGLTVALKGFSTGGSAKEYRRSCS